MMKWTVRITLAVFFLGAGILHFAMDSVFAQIVPPFLPYPVAIVRVTGVMEICFGVALLTGCFLPQTGLLLSLYLLAMLPANINMAMTGIDFGNANLTPAVLWARAASR
jgi:uncharacterized membrane protein